MAQFLSANRPQERANMMPWLMFVASEMGLFSGQAVHFKHFAPQPQNEAVNHFDFEAWHHWTVLNAHFATHHVMLGDNYTHS
jgi:GST-like protein